MEGLMMDHPLTLHYLLERAGSLFSKNEVVSRAPDMSLHRYTYGDFYRRTLQLANALRKRGVTEGTRVGTLCWNHYRHLELYFGIPAVGAVLHTLNLRLHHSQLAWIINHAEDQVVFVDRSLLPLYEQARREVHTVQHVVVLPDDGPTPDGYIDYEDLIRGEPQTLSYPTIDERAAAGMCYTSGTTGNPKGVVYTHRSIVLHTVASCTADALAVSENDTLLPVVPMFHANAWGLPFDAVLTGAKLVFPGPHLDPLSLLDLLAHERVTLTAGVPTIWLGILDLLDRNPGRWDLSALRGMVVGGSAAPPALIDGFRRRHGLRVIHAWGMTESDPLGTLARLKRHMADWDDAAKLEVLSKQGVPVPLVELRHVGDDGRVLPRDGATMGELQMRGPWVAKAYYKNPEAADRFTADGWFKTGDIVTIDEEGYIRITDRAKDVIKSGGEWISSVDLENALMGHPAVLEACVFAVAHPKWDERPLAAVVLKEGMTVSADDLRDFLAPHFAKWWLPDDFVFVDAIPRTSAGKFLKAELRDRFQNYLVKQSSARQPETPRR